MKIDVCVIGGGQAGLALGYYLRRLERTRVTALDSSPGGAEPVSFVILDDRAAPGGAWADGWASLRLFSPASFSSLPGWPMPPWTADAQTPSASHVKVYLRDYEERYDLPVQRPVHVTGVHATGRSGRLRVVADDRQWSARIVVNATGTWSRPFWPVVPGIRDFGGTQVHTSSYSSPEPFRDRRVLVVGGGNSGAQIAADLLGVAANVFWVTQRPPSYLPDDVDGRVLFQTATRHVQDLAAGRPSRGVSSLGDIVAVPAVREARDHGRLKARPMVERLTATGARWPDGHYEDLDAIIWCTGFRPALKHLDPLHLTKDTTHPATRTPDQVVAAERAARPDRPPTPISSAVESADDPRVLFLGYGDWCGPASATLIGVGRAARDVSEIIAGRIARRAPDR